MKRIHFAHFDLAGFTYWDGVIVFDQLGIGTKLRFKREQDNKYDPRAVAIYFEDNKIGYVPRSENGEISKLCQMGYGSIFDVRINRISPENQPESQIGIVVHLLKNKK